MTSASKSAPAPSSREPLIIREALAWDADRLAAFPWLRDLVDVPADASPPLAMTPPHPEAVCSYAWSGCTHIDDGHQLIDWTETEHGIELRWWQRLALIRQHEHRDDGSLCWYELVESAPRRAGKSVRIRAVATWRLSHAAVIGEVQTVIHCGNDLPICREIQRGAWRWATAKWGKEAVTVANGKEQIEAPDGSRWMTKSQEAAYGYDAGLAAVDEAWDVKPDTVTEGLEPMLLERKWAQLHITSTAHRRARSIMKTKIRNALAEDDSRTLLMLWGARPQDDPADPETWRSASPHWSDDRRRMIASKYEKAVLGEDDPQADDPDPMEGFRAQYLNIWPLTASPLARGEALVDSAAWGELTAEGGYFDRTRPHAVAVESWFDAGASVALAWQLPDGAAAVRVIDTPDLDAAAAAITATGYTGVTIVGASMVADPAFNRLRTTAGAGRVLQAVLDLAALLRDGKLVHTGETVLTDQILAVRTVQGADGPRMASQGRSDAIKAAAWAATAARSKPARRRSVGMVLPSSA